MQLFRHKSHTFKKIIASKKRVFVDKKAGVTIVEEIRLELTMPSIFKGIGNTLKSISRVVSQTIENTLMTAIEPLMPRIIAAA